MSIDADADTGKMPLAVGAKLPTTIASSVGLRVLQKVVAGGDKVDPVTRKDLEFVKHAVEGLMLAPTSPAEKTSPPTSKTSPASAFSASASSPTSKRAKNGLDVETVKWLDHFENGAQYRKRPTLAHVVRVVMASIRWAKATKDPQIDKNFDVPLLSKCLGGNLDTWSGFDVFQLGDLTGGHPLPAMCETLFWKRELLDVFPIKKATLKSYWLHIEGMYRNNPYHSTLHAVDVVHASHLLLSTLSKGSMTEIEILSILFGAAIHDVGHPGVTNDFRIAEGDEDAITYNDRSVNENMSLSISFLGLQDKDKNFLADFDDKQILLLRKMVVTAVLATDMATHFENFEVFKDAIKKQGFNVRMWEDKKTIREAVLHGADLSNPCRNLGVSRIWSSRVLEEFFAQGDRERALGRPLSPMCDRYIVSKPGSQVGFINFVVRPYFVELKKVGPGNDGVDNLAKVFDFWVAEKDKEDASKKDGS